MTRMDRPDVLRAGAAAAPLTAAPLDDADAWDAYMAAHPAASPFHSRAWCNAVTRATGHRCTVLAARRADGAIAGLVPLHDVRSMLFGRALVSSGFGVDGGILADDANAAAVLADAVAALAAARGIDHAELRGGPVLPMRDAPGWTVQADSHAGFIAPLASDDAAQLLAIPRKQRAEVRKALDGPLTVTTGTDRAARAVHYRVYATSVRNLGTPVFPRALFDAVLDAFGDDGADILTVWDGDAAMASVLSLYWRGAVMPYWGGGLAAARRNRANELMYFALMRHARARGCARFDFGRSKTGSGAYAYKKNWGFAPEPLSYAHWLAPGASPRDTNPNSPRYQARIRLWQKLPLWAANSIGPIIARGLG